MQEILDACSSLPDMAFEAGDLLIREGGAAGRLFVLVSGEVAVLKGETEVARIATPPTRLWRCIPRGSWRSGCMRRRPISRT